LVDSQGGNVQQISGNMPEKRKHISYMCNHYAFLTVLTCFQLHNSVKVVEMKQNKGPNGVKIIILIKPVPQKEKKGQLRYMRVATHHFM
jgi:hypothetical protein